MSQRSLRVLAWAMAVLAPILALSGLAFAYFNDVTERVLQQYSMVDVVLALSSPLGALIASRRPRNPIGWLFCGLGLDSGLTVFAIEYGSYGLEARPEGVPAAEFIYWIGTWVGILGFLFGVFLFLLFPAGVFVSRRWVGVALLATGLTIVAAVADALSPWSDNPSPSLANPLVVERYSEVAVTVREIAFTALIVCFMASAVALVMRLKNSRGHERQQLKWFAYAAVVAAVASVVALLHLPTWEILAPVTYALVPIATAIAVLKYRLYDIDVIIHRTLVYSALTAILAAVYVAVVIVLQVVFNPLSRQSELSVTGSTLVVAALFQPVRNRIQRFIDRSFYRAHYDAARTVETFSRRLTKEIDLETMKADLMGVVRKTLQPEHVSVWVRPSESMPSQAQQTNRVTIRHPADVLRRDE